MRGYKGMDKNMRCRDMQYEIGKTYQVEGEIELCKNGLHFCKDLNNVFSFYTKNNTNRFFEVEVDNAISDEVKSVTSKLTVIRELTQIEINRYFYGDGNGYGYGYGDGNGYGNGNGYGYGYGGDGNGNGYGDGNGDGKGNGYGDGGGDGYGNGDGDGGGSGYGRSIQKILNFK